MAPSPSSKSKTFPAQLKFSFIVTPIIIFSQSPRVINTILELFMVRVSLYMVHFCRSVNIMPYVYVSSCALLSLKN